MAFDLVVGEVLVVGPGEMIASDGTVIDGVAMVEESTITGESAPVIREAGTERNVVTGGTHVVSGRLTIEIT
jgi:K+-transporting ATPase ATPase B chain